jgi:3-hydroxyacyl-[acyl-carrier-protein] dehydratase
MPAPPLYDFSTLDFSRPVFDIEAIRRINPQRNQMEQLTAVVYLDTVHHGLVGYKDITDDEFWVPGHMPGFPLMPGVVMCEAAAQLAGFYARKFNLLGGDFVGFGGMDDIRFRIPVVPNCRLVLMARMIDLRPNRRARFDFQGYVNQQMAFSGNMIGVPINRDMGMNLGVRPEGSPAE